MPPSVPNGRLNWLSPKPASKAGSRRPTANTICRCSYRLSARGRAQADAQGRCDGAGSGESADNNSPAHDSSVRESLASTSAPRCFYIQAPHSPSASVPSQNSKPISLVKSLSGGLGPKTRRPPGGLCRALRILVFWAPPLLGYRSCLHSRVSYPTLACSTATVG